MQSGLIYGHMGVTELITRKMKAELMEYDKEAPEPKVIATGGLASLIESGIDCIDYVDKMLTLEGLQLIYAKNKNHKHRVGDCSVNDDAK